jgi:hypothetical protein
MADYQILISDPTGVRKATLTELIEGTYVKVQNDYGVCNLRFPEEVFDRTLLEVDAILEIERRPTGGTAYVPDWQGLIRKWVYSDKPDGTVNVTVNAQHCNELLRRRDIAYRSHLPQAEKTGPADDIMKAYVRENASNLAPVDEAGRARDFGTEFIVAADTGQGPEVSRQGSFKDLLQVLQQISESTIPITGNNIYFGMEYGRSGGLATFTFETYVNQVGTDRTVTSGASPVIFSKARENLKNAVYTVDWSEEWNYIWGLGPGEGSSRIIDPEKDVPRHTLTKWSRRENYQDARGETTQLGVAIKAFERLQKERPRELFTGELIDTPQHPYGEEWFFGDKVTAEFLDKQFDGNIQALQVDILEDGNEVITARIDSDEAATSG